MIGHYGQSLWSVITVGRYGVITVVRFGWSLWLVITVGRYGWSLWSVVTVSRYGRLSRLVTTVGHYGQLLHYGHYIMLVMLWLLNYGHCITIFNATVVMLWSLCYITVVML